MPAAVAPAPVAAPAARALVPEVVPAPAPTAHAVRHGRRRLHAALGPHVMRAVVTTATTLALIPALVVVARPAALLAATPGVPGVDTLTRLGSTSAVLVAAGVWVVAGVVGVPVGAVVTWLALRPIARRDLRRLAAALDGAVVVQGVGIRPGYGRSRAVELADGSLVTITRLDDRDDRGRQVGFTRSGGIDGIGRAAAAMALTAHQQAVGERPWFPSLLDGRRPRRWGTYGTTP